MSKKYYVKGNEIDLDYWTIELNDSVIEVLDDYDYDDVTDEHGTILGVAWETEV